MLSETEWTTFVLNANCTDTHTLDTRSSGFCSWIAKGKLPLRSALVEHHQQYMAITIFIYYCRELVSFLGFLVIFPHLHHLSFSLAR